LVERFLHEADVQDEEERAAEYELHHCEVVGDYAEGKFSQFVAAENEAAG
jgi:hypothetical protein